MKAMAFILRGLVPTVVGIAALVALLTHVSDASRFWSVEEDATPLLVLVVSVLTAAVGVDRMLHFNRLDSRLGRIALELNAIDQSVNHAVGGRLVEGADVYSSRARLWRKMETQVRTMISGGPKAPLDYINTIAAHLQSRKQAHCPVRFDVVMVIDPARVTAETVKTAHESRLTIFDKYDVTDCLHVHIVESNLPLNFDVLIVDSNHVNIGLPSFRGSNAVISAIEFQNQPKLAQDLANWFEHFALEKAIEIEAWLRHKSA